MTSTGNPAPPRPTAIVTGAGRGIGRVVAAGLVAAGLDVVGVARDEAALAGVAAALGPSFRPEPGDVRDDGLSARLLGDHRPQVVVLAAGATPTMRSLQELTWESFAGTWETDVRQTFTWVRQILLDPPAPGCRVVAFSSGAALRGSPLSGGYAGAKSTIRFVVSYAAQEAARAGLDLRFTCVLPGLTPETHLGAAAVAAYAGRAGQTGAGFVTASSPMATVEGIARAVVTIATDPAHDQPAYLLPPGGGLVPA